MTSLSKFSTLLMLSFSFPAAIYAQCTFNFTPGQPCPGETVTFTISSPVPGANYTWDLDGDGQFDDGTGTPVTFTYPYNANPVNFIVKLRQDNMDCAMQTVAVKAGQQPIIGVTTGQPINNNVIRVCSGGQAVLLGINNTTPNPGNITVYTVNWGDGSPVENHTNATFSNVVAITHNYTGAGFKTITITATHTNGCVLTNVYQYFNGGNPDIGLSSIGNTNGLCAPESLEFNVQSYQNNPPGTTYQFYENDVPIGPVFVQGNLPNPFVFSHLFDVSSCGEVTPDGQYQNAFSIKVVAKNPCGEKTAIVQPITASSKPTPDFSIMAPEFCPDRVVTFTNTTTNINEFDTQSNECVDTLNANWVITPGVMGTDWVYVSGGPFNFNTIRVRFLTPGTYSITMTLNPQPVCGPATITKTVTILEPPDANALAQFSNPNGCLPLTVSFDNQSTGYQISYNWHIAPPNGWSWQPGGGTNDITIENPTAVFTVPGDYMVTLTVTNVCATSTWVQPIEVKDRPSVTLPTLGPFCQAATLNFTPPTAPSYSNGNGTISSYNWSFPGGTPGSSTSANPSGIQYGPVTNATNFTYSVNLTNECGSNNANSTFEIQVPVPLTLPADITVCTNAQPFQLNPTPTGGTWSISPAGGVSPTGLFNPANSGGPGVKTLTYTYGTPGSPCTATKTMTITVVALPLVDVPPVASACLNETAVTLNSTPTSGGAWTTNNNGQISGNVFNPSASGAGIYTLTYTFTDANQCTNSDQTTLTVHPLPIVTSSDISYCNTPGLVALPSANPAGGTWSGTGVTGTQFNPQTPGGPTFTATYTYTNPQSGCSNSTNITITVSNPDNVNAGADMDFCVNAPTFNLNSDATPAVGGTWSGPGVTGNIFDPATAGAGLHTIQLTTGTGNCLVTDTRQIRVYPLPQVAAGPDASTCVSETILTLNGTPSSGGIWMSDGNGQIAGNVFNPATSGAGVYTLTYTFTDANQCTNSDQTTLTVHALPVVTSSDISYCNTPGLVALPSANPAGGSWAGTGVSGTQFNPQTPGGPTFTATYTYTNPQTNCVNSTNITITVTDPDNVSAGVDSAFCVDGMPFDLNIDATPASGGNWSGPGVTGNIFDPATAGAGLHTIQLTTGTGNCLVTDTRQIRVYPLPQVAAGPDASTCVSETILTLNGTPSSGGIWMSDGNGQIAGNVFNPATSGAGVYTLTYTFTDANQCTNSDQTILTVHALPVVTSSDISYCNTPGLVALPSANPAGGSWAGTGVTGTQFNPQTSGGPTFTATYTYTNPQTNCVNSTNITITVTDPDNVSAGVDSAFCIDGMPFDLNIDATPASGGNWSGPGVMGNSFDPGLAGAGTHTLQIQTGDGNCSVTDTRTIIVHPLPTVNAGADDEVCVSETSLPLQPNPPGGVWTPGNAVLIGNSFDPNASGVGDFTLVWAYTDPNGCQNSDVVQITVHPLPTPMAGDTVYCNTPGAVLLPTATPPGGSWSGIGNLGFSFDPIAAGGTGDYPQTYSFIDQNGCADSVTVTIQVIEPVPALAGPNDTICIYDGLLQLQGFSPATGGQWQGNGIIDSDLGVFDPSVSGGGSFPLIYTFGVGNCEQRDTTNILVIAVNIEAGNTTPACLEDGPITFTGFTPETGGAWTGTGITNVSGQFDPGTAGVGNHVLSYTFVDPILGCTFRDSFVMTVHPMPESNFAEPANTCINEAVQFQNLSTSTFQTLWNFGDGQTSSMAQPLHTYTDTGTYTIILTSTNEFGCTDMISRTIFVTEPPFAFFTPAPDTGCAVLPVSLQNGSYGWQTNYQWSIGSLWTDTLFTPAQVMLPGGTKDTFYVITLTATNLCAVRAWTDSILVHPLPLPRFGTHTDTICSGETIFFANTSLGQPESFSWNFGNGQVSSDSLPGPMTYFTDSLFRSYTIQLIATNFCGIDTFEHIIVVKPVDVKAFFNVPNLIGCQPYSVQFNNFATPGATVSWQFGDGNTSSDPAPMHTFMNPGTYKVVQKATAGCGFDSTLAYITVLPAPEVSFTNLPQICRNEPLLFTNTSPDPLSGVYWDFGNGDTSTLNTPAHAFNTAGLQTVTFTGISALNGCPGNVSGVVNVLELPNVQFTSDKIDGCMPLSVAFQIQPQGATYFEWDFGDGNTNIGASVSHIFTDDGQYEINLQGIDINGCRNDTLLRYITVHPIPSPAFIMDRDQLCGLPVTVDFTNQTPDAAGFYWSLGDGSGITQQNNPQNIYNAAGDYNIQLIAENSFLCRDTVSQIFSAYAQPVADFTWDPEKGCAPLEVRFENLSSDDTSAKWLFSDGGQSDSLQYTSYTFNNWGKYGATLIASHRNVCFDTLVLPEIIEVYPSPAANFSFQEVLTTPPSGLFEFMDLSAGAVRWLWDFGDGDSSELQQPTHRYFSNGPKEVTLTVWGENGCPNDTMLVVTPRPMYGLFIPNAFTPGLDNGDASLFQPKGVGLREFEIAVYSSYGQLLWSSGSVDLQDGRPGPGWDGIYKGNPMPQDVYTWQVIKAIFEDGSVWDGKRVGSVTLIR